MRERNDTMVQLDVDPKTSLSRIFAQTYAAKSGHYVSKQSKLQAQIENNGAEAKAIP